MQIALYLLLLARKTILVLAVLSALAFLALVWMLLAILLYPHGLLESWEYRLLQRVAGATLRYAHPQENSQLPVQPTPPSFYTGADHLDHALAKARPDADEGYQMPRGDNYNKTRARWDELLRDTDTDLSKPAR